MKKRLISLLFFCAAVVSILNLSSCKKHDSILYSVTIEADPTTGVVFSGEGNYAENSSVTVKTSPDLSTDLYFIGWFEFDRISPLSTELTYTFIINKDIHLVAKYGVNPKVAKIPDENLRNKLFAYALIEDAGNGEYKLSEAGRKITELNLALADISDITGLELFAENYNLRYLNLNSNENITDLTPIQSLTMLEELYCVRTDVVKLDVSMLKELKLFACSNGWKMTELKLGELPKLEYLYCFESTELTSLDLSGVPNLKELMCNASGKLENFVVGDKPNLEFLNISYVTVSGGILDLSKYPKLTMVNCQNSQISQLNLQGLTKLELLACENNPLTTLNISDLTSLNRFSCYGCLLTTMDATNMIFDDNNAFVIHCGNQITDEGVDITLSLKLRDDQKPFWNNNLKDDLNNANVVLVN